jgi:hypothetical protein
MHPNDTREDLSFCQSSPTLQCREMQLIVQIKVGTIDRIYFRILEVLCWRFGCSFSFEIMTQIRSTGSRQSAVDAFEINT